MAEVHKIQALPQATAKRKRVAAYARVSMESDNLLRSFSNQVISYSRMIQSRSDWEFAGVYADKGISGTSTAGRNEFNRMIRACEDGMIDMIITKSVSRFARNTVDLLEAIRHLRKFNVDVYFEEQGINTLSGDGEFMLTLLAALAQEESQSIKNNVEWLIRKKFGDGIPNGYKRTLGYDWDGEKYIVVPEEAKTVERIFSMYLAGNSSVKIARALNSEGIVNVLGNPFTDGCVRFILDNENYTGNLLLQKRYSPRPGKRAINYGEVPMYRVEDNHEEIISKETFAEVQKIRQAKAKARPDKNVTCFSGKLRCGYCGHSVCRRNVSNPKTKPSWICNSVDKKGVDACACTRRLAETELMEAVTDILGEDYEETIRMRLVNITVYDDKLVFQLDSGKPKIWERTFRLGPRGRGCFSEKVYCGTCGRLFTRRMRGQQNRIIWKYRKPDVKECCCPVCEQDLRHAVEDVFGSDSNYEMRFYCETDKLLVFNDRLEFLMKNGETTEWQRK